MHRVVEAVRGGREARRHREVSATEAWLTTVMKRILLHSCCAPCAPHVISILRMEYHVSIHFCNPNIQPYEEYEKRKVEIKRYAVESGTDIIFDEYDENGWLKAVKGHESDKEGGERCGLCFRYRLEKTAALCSESGFEIFATTLSVSPHKNSGIINLEGKHAAEKHGVVFLEADFKKNDGYRKSCELSHRYGFFRQNYCGCIFSRK